jgi:hypothetical protein
MLFFGLYLHAKIIHADDVGSTNIMFSALVNMRQKKHWWCTENVMTHHA